MDYASYEICVWIFYFNDFNLIKKNVLALGIPCLSNLLNISGATAQESACMCDKCGKTFKNKYSLGSHKKGCKGKKGLSQETILINN